MGRCEKTYINTFRNELTIVFTAHAIQQIIVEEKARLREEGGLSNTQVEWSLALSELVKNKVLDGVSSFIIYLIDSMCRLRRVNNYVKA